MKYQYLLSLLVLLVLNHEGLSELTAAIPKNNLKKESEKVDQLPVHSSNIPRTISEDVKTIYDAIESKDNEAIMNLLAKRNLTERLKISDYYNSIYDKEIVADLKNILSGDFKKLIVAMMTPTTKYYAGEIWNAVVGLGTDEKSLTEILITLNNTQINETSHYYYEAHQETVEAAIIDDTSGFFKNFLVSMSHADRSENKTTDIREALVDADNLHDSIDTRFETFNDIFTHRSYSQLNLTFREYVYFWNETIESTIEDNFSGDVKNGLLAVAMKSQNEAEYFAQRFYESMVGWGTRDSLLVRLAVTRSEIDIEAIKTEYKNKYSNSLAADIIDDTSGDYRKCLLILIGEENALE